jgi:hypothetical protein
VKEGFLSQYFTGAAVKLLRAVEVDPGRSNQHEFNSTKHMIEIFGRQDRKMPARFLYLSDDEDKTLAAESSITWYDARKNQTHRGPEYRLYFQETEIAGAMKPGDTIVFALRQNGSVLAIVARRGSTPAAQLGWLFGDPGTVFQVKAFEREDDIPLSFTAKAILEQIGVEITETDVSRLDEMIGRFGNDFPSVRVFSAYARSTVQGADPAGDPDGTLVTWHEKEEVLFRTFERHLVAGRMKQGFKRPEELIDFTMSVINRRKSRAGCALECQLEELLRIHGLRFSMRQITEGKSRPDFMFPCIEAYRDMSFPAERLKMLAAKRTCKDRWRQILTEAQRIPEKHLFTVEPAISADQTAEMQTHCVQLVLPRGIHQTYKSDQQSWLLDLADFIRLIESD